MDAWMAVSPADIFFRFADPREHDLLKVHSGGGTLARSNSTPVAKSAPT
jgi:hypothetical protein